MAWDADRQFVVSLGGMMGNVGTVDFAAGDADQTITINTTLSKVYAAVVTPMHTTNLTDAESYAFKHDSDTYNPMVDITDGAVTLYRTVESAALADTAGTVTSTVVSYLLVGV